VRDSGACPSQLDPEHLHGSFLVSGALAAMRVSDNVAERSLVSPILLMLLLPLFMLLLLIDLPWLPRLRLQLLGALLPRLLPLQLPQELALRSAEREGSRLNEGDWDAVAHLQAESGRGECDHA
jgi:hypothetical protein